MHPAVTFGQTTRIAYVLLMNNINFRPIFLNGMDLVIRKRYLQYNFVKNVYHLRYYAQFSKIRKLNMNTQVSY